MIRKNENIVIIFSKKPEIGRTKTRIAIETSPKFALEFTLACFSDLVDKIRGSSYYDLVVGVDTHEEVVWFERNFNISGFVVNPRGEFASISEKFHFLFSELTSRYGYRKVILIPMDIPFLTEEELISAFVRLDSHDYVLGPETDGGVYLIGINENYSVNIFQNVPWSTPNSFKVLMHNIISNHSEDSVCKLKYKTDLNTFRVVLDLRKEIALRCPNLFMLLRGNGYYLPRENRYVDYDDLTIRVPVVAALVEKEDKRGRPLLLVQTRYKPSVDPLHSGLLEIPSGLMRKDISVEENVVLEVMEETGIKCKVVGKKTAPMIVGGEVEGGGCDDHISFLLSATTKGREEIYSISLFV